jgi:glycosyltransferase involved in cell wall biosynthesis
VVNPTRCALLASDTWSTVSRSYREDLLHSSPLRHILSLAPHPFAHPNGIDIGRRVKSLKALGPKLGLYSHDDAKSFLQRKYFGIEPDLSLPLFGFVGRVTAQKGVHLILSAVESVLARTGGKALFIIGGMASMGDTYGQGCAAQMYHLRKTFPRSFWADPTAFFTDGVAVNLGSDFCLMPSMFEPGGIVQHEFFVAGTPVIAFRTGGLKDSVIEYDPSRPVGTVEAPQPNGNGFTFQRYDLSDFVASIHRALEVFHRPEHYRQCRINALQSVMPLSTVSRAWFEEFCRLRRSFPIPFPNAEAEDQEARQMAAPALRRRGIDPFDETVVKDLGAKPSDHSTPAVVVPNATGLAELEIVETGGLSDASTIASVPVRFTVSLPGSSANSFAKIPRSRVLIAGSWDGWKHRAELTAGSHTPTGTLAVVLPLPSGSFQYKYIVVAPGAGDQWVVDPSQARGRDAEGNENNIVRTTIRHRFASTREKEARALLEEAVSRSVRVKLVGLLEEDD